MFCFCKIRHFSLKNAISYAYRNYTPNIVFVKHQTPNLVYSVNMGFAENLRTELDFQDVQIKELSLKTGISKNTLDKYLSGPKVQPSVDNAVKIAQALGVSVEYLATGKAKIAKKLSAEHEKLLSTYQKLTAFNKKTVFDLLNSLASRQEK